MGKRIRKVWTPNEVEIELGQTEYVLRPQPLRRYLEFEERLRELGSFWMPKEEEAEETEGAEEPEETEEIGEVAERAIKPLVQQGVEAIYEVLRFMIPDLEIEDVWDASEPQLEHCLKLCLEINGGQWAQALIKDFFTPLLPGLRALLADWLLRLSGEKTPTESGEVPQTT